MFSSDSGGRHGPIFQVGDLVASIPQGAPNLCTLSHDDWEDDSGAIVDYITRTEWEEGHFMIGFGEEDHGYCSGCFRKVEKADESFSIKRREPIDA